MRALLAIILSLCGGCSYAVDIDHVPQTGAHLFCERVHDVCPALSDIEAELVAFSGWVPGFDVREVLDVHFHDHDMTWDLREPYGVAHAYGYTEHVDTVHVVGMNVLTHELMHVQFWRTTGDGDANHSTPPGPWNDMTSASIDAFNARADWRPEIR